DRSRQRFITAGDDADDLARVGAERRRAFAGIQDTQPPAGAGSHVDQAPPGTQRRGYNVDGRGNVFRFRSDGLGHPGVFRVDQTYDSQRVQRVDVAGGGVTAFGCGGVGHACLADLTSDVARTQRLDDGA